MHIYSSALRPGRPAHTHRPAYPPHTGKPSLYGGSHYAEQPSYATWSHDRPTNDLAIGHERPSYVTRPHHTGQMDFAQDEYEGGHAASGVHAPPIEGSSNTVDYSRYRGNRMGEKRTPVCCTESVAQCVSRRDARGLRLV